MHDRDWYKNRQNKKMNKKNHSYEPNISTKKAILALIIATIFHYIFFGKY